MTAARVTTRQPLYTCPACRIEVAGEFALSVEIVGPVKDDGTAEVKATILGVRVQHDCIPKVTR